jgi:hypothetical protein
MIQVMRRIILRQSPWELPQGLLLVRVDRLIFKQVPKVGRVAQLRARPGATVKVGEVLAVID